MKVMERKSNNLTPLDSTDGLEIMNSVYKELNQLSYLQMNQLVMMLLVVLMKATMMRTTTTIFFIKMLKRQLPVLKVNLLLALKDLSNVDVNVLNIEVMKLHVQFLHGKLVKKMHQKVGKI